MSDSGERSKRLGRQVPTDPGLEEIVARMRSSSGRAPVYEALTDGEYDARYYADARRTEAAKVRWFLGRFLLPQSLAKVLPDSLLWPIAKKWGELPPDPKRTSSIGNQISRIVNLIRR